MIQHNIVRWKKNYLKINTESIELNLKTNEYQWEIQKNNCNGLNKFGYCTICLEYELNNNYLINYNVHSYAKNN